MTQRHLNHAVAIATGESRSTIRRLGFQVQVGPPDDLEPEDLSLAVACPFCGRRCDLMADADGLPAMAECDPCDVYFDYRPDEVDAVGSATRPRIGARNDAETARSVYMTI
jgi:hypothetical protein